MPWPNPITLESASVVLDPLSRAHETDLVEAAADGDLHLLWYTIVPTPDRMGAEIDRRLGLQVAGSMLPFAVRCRQSGKAVGMTTYMNIDAANRRLEIGSTWYRKSVQRTGINTECKHMLLWHAFDSLGCIAVELRTHFMNRPSRQAIERLGAKLDGTLRSHQMKKFGFDRTCVNEVVGILADSGTCEPEANTSHYRRQKSENHHVHGSESHQGEGRLAGAGQAARQRESSLQDHGLQPR